MAPSGVLMIGAALVLCDWCNGGSASNSGSARLSSAPRSPPGWRRRRLLSPRRPHFCCRNSPISRSIPRLPAAAWYWLWSASSAGGLVVDSIVFLWLAFGSLEFLLGQIIGKLWMVLLAVPFVAFLRRRDERLGLNAA